MPFPERRRQERTTAQRISFWSVVALEAALVGYVVLILIGAVLKVTGCVA